jgi:hypothetical protein
LAWPVVVERVNIVSRGTASENAPPGPTGMSGSLAKETVPLVIQTCG